MNPPHYVIILPDDGSKASLRKVFWPKKGTKENSQEYVSVYRSRMAEGRKVDVKYTQIFVLSGYLDELRLRKVYRPRIEHRTSRKRPFEAEARLNNI
jgi:hypothetical protein